MSLLSFIKSTFSEPTGEGSTARVLSGVFGLATIVWVSHIVFKTHALPDLSSTAAFITAPYASNKIATMIGKIGKPDEKG